MRRALVGTWLTGLCIAGPAAAAEPALRPDPAVPLEVSAALAARPTLSLPWRTRLAEGAGADPSWTLHGLFASPPRAMAGLAGQPHAGVPVFDPSSDSWFASSAGGIVRVEADGSLQLVVPDVQGLDIDVRAAVRVAVSRETPDTIVVHRWGKEGRSKNVILRGDSYFEPRLSPDARQVLVAQSRADGGHLWTVDLSGHARDLGQGYGAVWHPDGKRILFGRLVHNGERVTAGELWVHDLSTGRQTVLTSSPDVAEAEPTVSGDGRWLAFVDALRGDLCIAAFPKAVRGGGR